MAFYSLVRKGSLEVDLNNLRAQVRVVTDNLGHRIDRQQLASSQVFTQIEDKFKDHDRKVNKTTRDTDKKIAQVREMARKLGESHNWSGFDEGSGEITPKTWQQHLDYSEQRRTVLESEKDFGIVRTIFSPMDFEVMVGTHFISAVFDHETDGKIIGHPLLSSTWEEALEAHQALEKFELNN
jgi:hypothetical protein